MQVVPTQAVPNQTINVVLANQNCTINLRQTDYGMFGDLLVNDEPIVQGVACENLNRWVRDVYLGFAGDVCVQDTQGLSDPVYTGLGTRFQLVYLSASDLAALGLTA